MAVMPERRVSQAALGYISSFGIDATLIPEDSVTAFGYEVWVVPKIGDTPATEYHKWPEGFDWFHLCRIWSDKAEVGMTDVQSFEEKVHGELDTIGSMLIEKNKAYGNSALDPVRIFSGASPEEQLLVRIDDKLSRLQRGHDFADEDTVTDLIGYLILLKIARK